MGVSVPTARRVVWTISSQGLSSLGNVAVVVLGARALSAAGFGHLAVALVVYSTAVGLSRALVSDPLMVRAAARPPEEARRAGRAALSAALGAAAIAGLLIAGVGVLIGGGAGTALAVLGLGFPLVLGQDLLRHGAFVLGRPLVAAASDLVWLGLAAAALLGPAAGWATTPGRVLAVWAASAGPAALLAAGVLRLAPGPGGLAAVRGSLSFSGAAAVELLCLSAASQGAILVAAALGPAAAAGSLRAAGTLLGPVGVLSNGAHAAVVVEGARADDRVTLRRVAGRVPALMAAVTALWGLVLSLLPTGAGEVLLGDSWSATRDVLVPQGLVFAGLAAATQLGAVLRALDQVGRAARAALPMMAVALVAAALAAPHGARAVAFAMVAPAWLGAALYGRQAGRALREGGPRDQAGTEASVMSSIRWRATRASVAVR